MPRAHHVVYVGQDGVDLQALLLPPVLVRPVGVGQRPQLEVELEHLAEELGAAADVVRCYLGFGAAGFGECWFCAAEGADAGGGGGEVGVGC